MQLPAHSGTTLTQTQQRHKQRFLRTRSSRAPLGAHSPAPQAVMADPTRQPNKYAFFKKQSTTTNGAAAASSADASSSVSPPQHQSQLRGDGASAAAEGRPIAHQVAPRNPFLPAAAAQGPNGLSLDTSAQSRSPPQPVAIPQRASTGLRSRVGSPIAAVDPVPPSLLAFPTNAGPSPC